MFRRHTVVHRRGAGALDLRRVDELGELPATRHDLHDAERGRIRARTDDRNRELRSGAELLDQHRLRVVVDQPHDVGAQRRGIGDPRRRAQTHARALRHGLGDQREAQRDVLVRRLEHGKRRRRDPRGDDERLCHHLVQRSCERQRIAVRVRDREHLADRRDVRLPRSAALTLCHVEHQLAGSVEHRTQERPPATQMAHVVAQAPQRVCDGVYRRRGVVLLAEIVGFPRPRRLRSEVVCNPDLHGRAVTLPIRDGVVVATQPLIRRHRTYSSGSHRGAGCTPVATRCADLVLRRVSPFACRLLRSRRRTAVQTTFTQRSSIRRGRETAHAQSAQQCRPPRPSVPTAASAAACWQTSKMAG